ncbi:MAG: site-2 protease family protein [Candidatus Aenigmarchaeota archaeon]|nr:site-2 protease family protein [Candidatus Aenigmarchaeota archaeon]
MFIQETGFIIFLLTLAVLIWRDRKKIKFEGLMFIRRTKKGKKFINRIARHKTFWSAFSKIGVVVAICGMIFISGYLVFNAHGIATREVTKGAGLVLPSASAKPVIKTGFILLPWWLWVIAIITIMVPHELSHGIISRIEKIKIKSLGVLLLLFLPGAFVEPDEKQLKKSKLSTRLKVYSAGSFANLIVAAIFLFLFLTMFNNLYVPSGITFASTINGTDAYNKSLNGTIIAINDYKISNIENLTSLMKNITPGKIIQIKTTTGNYSIKTYKQENKTMIGIQNVATLLTVKEKYSKSQLPLLVLNTFNWLWILNLSVGLINLLPLKPLDGGFIFQGLIEKKVKKRRAEKITNYVSVLAFLVLMFNIIGPWIMKLL